MAADDVALAWVRMHDDDVRRKVVAGEIGALGGLDLSTEEQGIVRRVAEEGLNPEVEAFQSSAFYDAFMYANGKLTEAVLAEVNARIRDDEVSGFAMHFPAPRPRPPIIWPGPMQPGGTQTPSDAPAYCAF